MQVSAIKSLFERGPNGEIAFVPERTAAISLAETLSALANARGGTVLLGVTHAGAVRGVRDPIEQSDRVLSAALLVTPPLILPLPTQAQVDGRSVVLVEVPAGLPNVYRTEDRYLIRDGPHNRPLKAAEVHQLLAQRGVVDMETLPPSSATLDDLDWAQVRQYANRLSGWQDLDGREILRRRGCIIEQEGTERPTYAGLLLFGREPSQWIANAGITAVRYPEREMGDAFTREDIVGPLAAQIRRAEAFLQANTTQEVSLDGLTREEQPAYPQAVLREVIVNAIAHRDYAIRGESIRVSIFGDRIEVYSPGKLPGHVTVENIVNERFSRNPVIVQVLADLGFIERLGYGIDRMLHLLQQAGHPAPTFEETAAGFRVTILAKAAQPESKRPRWVNLELNPRQEQALRYVIEQGRITNREYQTLCAEVSAETIRRDLSDLVHKDVLLRIGRKRATYYILKDATLAKE